ncbi:hypothetical protein [Flavobacterium sp.]|uniref:hypothetical protein n=1 Tax=Flavobacterium sp. TaxID=239 RepID=UPI003D118374
MRVFDLNDCYVKDEVYFYKSVLESYSYVFFSIVTLIASIVAFWLEAVFLGFMLTASSIFIFYKFKVYSKGIDEIQLTINLEGVRYKDREIVKWENIENERVVAQEKNVGSEDSYTIYSFSCYCKSTDSYVVINSSEIEIDIHILVSVLKIFRHRSKS